MHDLVQFGMALAGRGSADCLDPLDIGRAQAFAQHTLAQHARGAEYEDIHAASAVAAVGARAAVAGSTMHVTVLNGPAPDNAETDPRY
jgi:hypothetical protein